VESQSASPEWKLFAVALGRQCARVGGCAVMRVCLLGQVYRTLVHGSHQCDAFIPAELPPCFERDSGERVVVCKCCARGESFSSGEGLTAVRAARSRRRAAQLHQGRERDQVRIPGLRQQARPATDSRPQACAGRICEPAARRVPILESDPGHPGDGRPQGRQDGYGHHRQVWHPHALRSAQLFSSPYYKACLLARRG